MDAACHPVSDKTRLLNAEDGGAAGGREQVVEGRLEAGFTPRQAPLYANGYDQPRPFDGQQTFDRPTYVIGMNNAGLNYAAPYPSGQVPLQNYAPQPMPQSIIYGQVRNGSGCRIFSNYCELISRILCSGRMEYVNAAALVDARHSCMPSAE